MASERMYIYIYIDVEYVSSRAHLRVRFSLSLSRARFLETTRARGVVAVSYRTLFSQQEYSQHHTYLITRLPFLSAFFLRTHGVVQ